MSPLWVCAICRLQSIDPHVCSFRTGNVYCEAIEMHWSCHVSSNRCAMKKVWGTFDIEDTNIANFKLTCKNHVRNSSIENWTHQINDIHTNPIVRTYAIFKHSFGFEPYLKQISNTRYRNALTKLRVSSQSLAIERGRRLGTAIQERLCTVCNVIEDEKHFLFECCINGQLRFIFNSRVNQFYPQYQYLDSDQKLVCLFEIENEQLITWVGKFVYNSFCLRDEYHGKRV